MRFIAVGRALLTLSAFASTHGFADSYRRPTRVTRTNFEALAQKYPKLLVYTVSGGMPLSLRGLSDVRKIAKERGYRLKVLNDPFFPVADTRGRPLHSLIPREPYFIERGFFHHFPSLALFKNGAQCGEAVPGYLKKTGFGKLVRTLEGDCGETRAIQIAKGVSADLGATLIKESPVPRMIQYYMRPLGNDWVSYHTGAVTALFNRQTLQEIPFQGQIDSIGSPDGKYLTLPMPLRFYSVAKILADPQNAMRLAPELSDKTMDDQYQSIGIVAPGHYRVMTKWEEADKSRDYVELALGFMPFLKAKTLCPDLSIGTPMLSKDGRYFGAYIYHGQGDPYTTSIIKIGVNADMCDQVFDLGVRASKVDFNFDNTKVAYIARDEQNANLGAFVTDFKSGITWKVADMAPDESLTFPSFLPNGNVLVLRVKAQRTPLRQFSLQEYQLASK